MEDRKASQHTNAGKLYDDFQRDGSFANGGTLLTLRGEQRPAMQVWNSAFRHPFRT
jgi:hypothetical protein